MGDKQVFIEIMGDKDKADKQVSMEKFITKNSQIKTLATTQFLYKMIGTNKFLQKRKGDKQISIENQGRIENYERQTSFCRISWATNKFLQKSRATKKILNKITADKQNI